MCGEQTMCLPSSRSHTKISQCCTLRCIRARRSRKAPYGATWHCRPPDKEFRLKLLLPTFVGATNISLLPRAVNAHAPFLPFRPTAPGMKLSFFPDISMPSYPWKELGIGNWELRIFLIHNSSFLILLRVRRHGQWPKKLLSNIPDRFLRGTGILTCSPSATPFGLALGPTNPTPIDVAWETLEIRWAGFSPALWLLIPTVALQSAPPDLTVRLHCCSERSSTAQACPKAYAHPSLRLPVLPRWIFGAWRQSTSELLRFL